MIANYIPLEAPAGGPNFFEFGDDVLYSLHIGNNGAAEPNITYDFQFETRSATRTRSSTTRVRSARLRSALQQRQFYSRDPTSTARPAAPVPGDQPARRPPCNIGPLSTPDYAALAEEAVNSLPGGRTVFAGQRLEGFYVDLGAVFDW